MYPSAAPASWPGTPPTALREVQEDLKDRGYRLKVFDGYRPRSVQRIFWNICPDPKFVADPEKGSVHNRGYAVDLTLLDLQGRELPMPTPFGRFHGKRPAPTTKTCRRKRSRTEEFSKPPWRNTVSNNSPASGGTSITKARENKPNLDISFEEIDAMRH